MNIVIKRNLIFLIIILIVFSIIISTGVEIVKLKIKLSTTKNSNNSSNDSSSSGNDNNSLNSDSNNSSNDINENLNVWPLPYHFQIGNNIIRISNNFKIQSNLVTSAIHNKTISKYYNQIFTQDNLINQDESTLNILQIQVYSNDETLNFGFNESYILTIPDTGSGSGSGISYLKSHNIYGAMRGLETFYQLVMYNFTDGCYSINQCPIEIIDKPRFPHRGFLMDTSRHFIPMEFMYKIIDSMSYNKLNTFHWHVIDSQSFPLTSKTFPNLTMGAWSSQEIYSYKNIESIIQYSKENGIRVVLEIDIPGHAKSWGVAYPDVTPENIESIEGCPWNCTTYCNVPLDPSADKSYEIAYGLLKEFTNKSIFQLDDFFHIGGDEISYSCWNNSNKILQWMENQNLKDFQQVARYFELKMINKLIEFGKKPVMWEDTYLLFKNQSDQLPKDVIIQIYHNPLLAINITNDGYYTIQSPARPWYLEYSYSNWISAYEFEPTLNISSSKLHFILGGQGCLWSETIDPSNLFNKMYPSLSAVAERLWSNQNVIDINGATKRLEKFRCNSLLKRSIGSSPIINSIKGVPSGPFSCYSS